MSLVNYFAYGSNMAPSEVKRWQICLGKGAAARLDGYRLDFTRWSKVRDCGVGDIVADPAAHVWGVFYPGVGGAQIKELDKKEGAPTFYRRVEVMVSLNDGSRKQAATYEVVNKGGPFLPSRHYLNLYLEGARYYGPPQEYIAFLESIPTQELNV